MKLATELIRYFASWPPKASSQFPAYTIGAFGQINNIFPDRFPEVFNVCQKLVQAGIIIPLGVDRAHPMFGQKFYCPNVDHQMVDYNSYEYIAYGFSEIWKTFRYSVIPITVVRPDDKHDIGSAFLAEGNFIITAKHCVENMKEIWMPNFEHISRSIEKVYFPNKSNLDVAIFRAHRKNTTHNSKHLRLRPPEILEEVLTMGYPPIPGFDAILASEKAIISAIQKGAVGSVTSVCKSYLDRTDYILVSAKVKGGNSGGPVIGSDGHVVGMITQIPALEEGRPDLLGYALALPSDILMDLLLNIQHDPESFDEIGITTDNGVLHLASR